MAGACPVYGSGVNGRSVATVTQVPPKMVVKRSKEEEEMIAKKFRDVSETFLSCSHTLFIIHSYSCPFQNVPQEYYRFWETSF